MGIRYYSVNGIKAFETPVWVNRDCITVEINHFQIKRNQIKAIVTNIENTCILVQIIW